MDRSILNLATFVQGDGGEINVLGGKLFNH
jgi:hypothetical protein